MDFSLDDGPNEAKPVEVPAHDLLGQDAQRVAEFPPKEWWDDEEELTEGTTAKMANKEKRPVLKASKLLAANERPKERRRELPPLAVEEERVDLPPKNEKKVCVNGKIVKNQKGFTENQKDTSCRSPCRRHGTTGWCNSGSAFFCGP